MLISPSQNPNSNLINQLKLQLPPQPPPKITTADQPRQPRRSEDFSTQPVDVQRAENKNVQSAKSGLAQRRQPVRRRTSRLAQLGAGRQPHACRAPPSPRVQPPRRERPRPCSRSIGNTVTSKRRKSRAALGSPPTGARDRARSSAKDRGDQRLRILAGATIPRPGREGGALRNPGVKLGDDPRWAPLPPAAARPERAGLGRLAAITGHRGSAGRDRLQLGARRHWPGTIIYRHRQAIRLRCPDDKEAERGGRRSAGSRVMVAEMRSGQGNANAGIIAGVAGQLSHATPCLFARFRPISFSAWRTAGSSRPADATVTAEIEALPTDVRGRLEPRRFGLIQSLGLGHGSRHAARQAYRGASYGKFERRAGTA